MMYTSVEATQFFNSELIFKCVCQSFHCILNNYNNYSFSAHVLKKGQKYKYMSESLSLLFFF